MWRATLRERRTSNHFTATAAHTFRKSSSSKGKRFQHNDSLALQLDYYMSPQFAGVASAIVNDTYKSNGIDLRVLPTCPVGMEQANVRKFKDANPSTVVMGSVEQNIFSPNLAANPGLKTTAVASMFAKSPLCIASLKDPALGGGLKIGTHEDTVEVMKRIFPFHDVIASPRATKNTDLISGQVEAIQAYTTTEVPALRRSLGEEPVVTELEGLNGTKLGYSQVIFTADECLQGDQRSVVQKFLQATFLGWEDAIRNSEQAVEMVKEAKKILGLDDESNDHWHPSHEFEIEMLEKCSDYVKGTFEGDRYGVINARRWNEANTWLLNDMPSKNFGLDAEIWQPPKNLLSGNNLARTILEDAKASAKFFEETYGRKPSLAVITVGDLKRYKHGDRRRQIYSNSSHSWFSKTSTGEANGFFVQEIDLDSTTSTDELLSTLYNLRNFDGIQLMWPLPEHIDTAKVFSAIDVEKDVDGIHYVGQMEIGNNDAYPPVTPAAALALMDEFNVEIKGKRVLVIGRSVIVGSPMAQMIRSKGGAVTVAHSQLSTSTLKTLVGEADIIISCAGSPGLVKAEWIKGSDVINVGNTFIEELDSLVSDVDGEISKYAARFSPVPGGIGPLSAPMLFKNVTKAAWNQMKENGALIESGWERKPESLRKSYHFENYTAALEAANKINEMSTIMDHHANLKFTHNCSEGVDLDVQFFTYEASQITEKDYDAAKAVDMVLSKDMIEMKKYSYKLNDDNIAKYPAFPRGTSKLLKYDESGKVAYYENFSNVFSSLSKQCHIVFNDSLVLDARLFVKDTAGQNIELMILDLGSIDVAGKCEETILQAMIRSEDVKAGDRFKLDGSVHVEVVKVKGTWEEDSKSDGNGTECFVRINTQQSVENFLSQTGTVPIPPYLNRSSEIADKEAYNNTFAINAGSVAAPTAGLHFTKDLLTEIGAKNCSYLSLHVGAGTFKPVMVKDARDHKMHAETFAVSVKELRSIIDAMKSKKEIIVVGTTSSRTLESLFWCGVKRIRGLDDKLKKKSLILGQFDWIALQVGEGKSISSISAFEALVDGLDDGDVIHGKTSLMISPPFYDFKVADHLVTNFHAPDSTLMLLVSAFINDSNGSKIPKLYEEAQSKGYRFLSYGDVCMFSRRH